MFENKQKKMISRILAHHGFKNQLIKTVEELSELTTAIGAVLQQRTGREPIKGRARGDSRRIHHARANPEAVHERLRTERTD